MSVYSARIRAARCYKDWTQTQLADALGVDEQTIKRRESPNGKEPKKGERIAIATLCGVPPEFLEQGFGAWERDEIADRLARLEAALGVDRDSPTDVLEAETAEAAQRHDTRSDTNEQAKRAQQRGDQAQ